MAVEDVLNFVQLLPEVATSGQPTAEQFAEIAVAGYSAVINLALPSSDNAVAGEGDVVTRLGLAHFHVPVKFDAPRVEELRTFIGLMRMLEGQRVWVHCAMNLRVSAFMYHYLRHVRGFAEAEARSPVLERWAPRMDEVWRAFLALGAEDIGAASSGVSA